MIEQKDGEEKKREFDLDDAPFCPKGYEMVYPLRCAIWRSLDGLE